MGAWNGPPKPAGARKNNQQPAERLNSAGLIILDLRAKLAAK